MTTPPEIAFYAPMKAPDHPNPSGDRHIARLTLQALILAGFGASCVSRLRSLDLTGDPAAQTSLLAEAKAETARLIAELAAAPPALWFTYHCYYKAPDLLGPAVANALGIPYVISEASISPKRRDGPWAEFAALSDTAIARTGVPTSSSRIRFEDSQDTLVNLAVETGGAAFIHGAGPPQEPGGRRNRGHHRHGPHAPRP